MFVWYFILCSLDCFLINTAKMYIHIAIGLVWKGTSHYKSSSSWPTDDVLLNVQVFHRHGDRTPATLLRKDRDKENQLWANKVSKQYSPLRYKRNKDNPEDDDLNFTTKRQSNIKNLSEIYQWNNIAKKLNGTYIVHKKDNYDSFVCVHHALYFYGNFSSKYIQ